MVGQYGTLGSPSVHNGVAHYGSPFQVRIADLCGPIASAAVAWKRFLGAYFCAVDNRSSRSRVGTSSGILKMVAPDRLCRRVA